MLSPCKLFLCTLALGTAACSDPPPKARNVILISIDTLRPDHLGCYGYERDTSPAIDRLAQDGVVFEDCISAAPWTLPAHASMLTGLYPSTHGVKSHEFALRPDSLSLATMLKGAGRRTMAIVNSHNIGTEKYGLAQGFDSFDYVPEMVAVPGAKTPQGFQKYRIINNGKAVTRLAREVLDEHKDEPFFLFLHYYDVHTDFTPRRAYRERFVDPYDGKLLRDGQLLTEQLSGYRKRDERITADDARWLRQMYDAEIAQLDHMLQGFFRYLDEQGLSENTLVVITSDHGEEYGEHGGVLHGCSQYQELLAIPLILRGPGVPQGQRFAQSVSIVDVVPTVLRLAGVRLEHAIDGIDASMAWRDPAAWPLRYLYGEADHNNWITHESERKKHFDVTRMVRLGNDKLHFNEVTGAYELYNLRADPWEQNDLFASDDEELGKRRDVLLAQLLRFQEAEGSGKPIPTMPAEERSKLEQLGY